MIGARDGDGAGVGFESIVGVAQVGVEVQAGGTRLPDGFRWNLEAKQIDHVNKRGEVCEHLVTDSTFLKARWQLGKTGLPCCASLGMLVGHRSKSNSAHIREFSSWP